MTRRLATLSRKSISASRCRRARPASGREPTALGPGPSGAQGYAAPDLSAALGYYPFVFAPAAADMEVVPACDTSLIGA